MGRMGHADRDVVIRLTHDEALVLFELLHRWEDQDRVTQPEHHADYVALWNLSCLLEREHPESARAVNRRTRSSAAHGRTAQDRNR
jgi:hypothetical protein